MRPVRKDDLNSIHDLHSLPETDEFNTLGIPENIGVTQKIMDTWIDELTKNPIQSYTFVIELIEDSKFAGLIAINLGKPKYRLAETWFKLLPDAWGNGYATEAVKAIIDFGFNELNLHRIEAGCAVGNIASMKVLEKAGMKQEGRTRKKLPLKSGWSDNYEYAILVDD
ncbi:MAG TPA: GNAT family N-acetyltransferase [Saprospiraceae bacterium]|nr:GNAT family N-acetyltransferase [Saprospiraceae bacterium]